MNPAVSNARQNRRLHGTKNFGPGFYGRDRITLLGGSKALPGMCKIALAAAWISQH
jgi:hypothetical protein